MDRQSVDAPRVLMIELGGALYEVLAPMAATAPMPHLGRLLERAALARLRSDGVPNGRSARATVATGCAPGRHGVLDDHYFDHHRRQIVAWHDRAMRVPTLDDLVTAADPSEPARRASDDGAGLWQQKPADLDELAAGIATTKAAMQRAVDDAERIDGSGDWRLLSVRFTAINGLLHRLWHFLGVGEAAGGNRRWIAKTQEAFRTWDDCLGRLLELASRRDAAVVLVSPLGLCPFREKITVTELLRHRDLLRIAGAAGRIGYRLARCAWKVGATARGGFSPFGVLPADWRRTRAVALHGRSAALVYLNTAQRFGGRGLTSPGERRRVADEVLGTLTEARHPSTGEPLFKDVFLAEEHCGCDPLERLLPEVVAVPGDGFQVRHRLDRNRHVMRRDPSLTAVHGGEGLLMIHAPQAIVGQPCTAGLVDVAPTVLAMLGLPSGQAMEGRVLGELFEGQRQEVNQRQSGDPAHAVGGLV